MNTAGTGWRTLFWVIGIMGIAFAVISLPVLFRSSYARPKANILQTNPQICGSADADKVQTNKQRFLSLEIGGIANLCTQPGAVLAAHGAQQISGDSLCEK